MTFDDLKLIHPILSALKSEGYTTPTPIQEKAIPLVLEGRDLLGCAQTGTGKTAAFAIPIIQLLDGRKPTSGRRSIRSLILTPTRELAIQIGESFENYGKNTPLTYHVIFGGVNQHSQVQALKRGLDVLIATPGRLLDLMGQGFISLKDIEFFVLDEADRMLDMGFVHDVKRVIKELPHKRQSLFFSAKKPPVIVELANKILTNPGKVEVTPASSTVDKINQAIYFVDKGNKTRLLIDVIKENEMDRVLVFTRTKHGADKVVKLLNKSDIHSQAIHGNKSQNARQGALKNFKEGTTRALVATDIAARGIDIDDLAFVINYELPNIPESYVHRIGRTGRAGADGIAISFCDAIEKEYLRDIEKLIGKKIRVVENALYPLVDHNPEKPKQEQRPPRQKRSFDGKTAKPSNSGNANKKSWRGRRPPKRD
ncbi:MAG: DEAD/DEAH box helicase [Cyclobacteriaceae bacterium]